MPCSDSLEPWKRFETKRNVFLMYPSLIWCTEWRIEMYLTFIDNWDWQNLSKVLSHILGWTMLKELFSQNNFFRLAFHELFSNVKRKPFFFVWMKKGPFCIFSYFWIAYYAQNHNHLEYCYYFFISTSELCPLPFRGNIRT